jgi:uncharacterized protein (DUF2235 family)
MAKNILIFSDGTGQAGGLAPDEERSNVYKLFTATRSDQQNGISPQDQVAFYDPGLGSPADGAEFKIGVFRKIYNMLAGMTGLGITRNIEDCYCAILRLWRPGDRVWLIGFSRGAYTVRAVAGVLGLVGIPTEMPDGTPLRRDDTNLRAIAADAVAVYKYGNVKRRNASAAVVAAIDAERKRRADEFHRDYETAPGDPHFIGVFDTVASIGISTRAVRAAIPIGGVFCVLFALAGWLVRWICGGPATAPIAANLLQGALFTAAILAGVLAVCSAVLGFRQSVGGAGLLSGMQLAFKDRVLGSGVAHARHAISIDENRFDFQLVPWEEFTDTDLAEEPGKPARLKQVWFAGVHSDVGGSYPDNEAGLSDTALGWLLGEMASIPGAPSVNTARLTIFPDHAGPQHDERKSARDGIVGAVPLGLGRLIPERLKTLMTWAKKERNCVLLSATGPVAAVLHPSVLARFGEKAVPIYWRDYPYLPPPFAHHPDVAVFYPAGWQPPGATRTATRPSPVARLIDTTKRIFTRG